MRILLPFCLLCFPIACWGQNFLFQNQYNFRPYLVNPALAGDRNGGNVAILYMKQLTGFDNSPNSQVISADFPLPSSKIGFGINGFKDRNGSSSFTGVETTFAYHLVRKLEDGNPVSGLSFGLSGTYNQFNLNGTSWKPLDADDLTLADINRFSESFPNANLGFNFFSYGFNAGLSVYNLIPKSSNIYLPTDIQNALHFILSTSYSASLKDKLKLTPRFLCRIQQSGDYQLDLATEVTYVLSGGASFSVAPFYRNFGYSTLNGRQSFGINLLVVRKPLEAGYQIDIPLSSINRFSTGNHVFFLAIKIKDQSKKAEKPELEKD